MTLGLAVTFENFQNFLYFSLFFYLKQFNRKKNSGIHHNACRSRCLITPLYLTLSCVVTNLPNKTSIFHDFQGSKIKFHDFSGLENEILKLDDFQGFPSPVRTLFSYSSWAATKKDKSRLALTTGFNFPRFSVALDSPWYGLHIFWRLALATGFCYIYFPALRLVDWSTSPGTQ